MKNNHLDKPHLCSLYGCMTIVNGGEFACDACERDLTDEERDDLVATWMHNDFDAIVERIQERVRVARVAVVP